MIPGGIRWYHLVICSIAGDNVGLRSIFAVLCNIAWYGVVLSGTAWQCLALCVIVWYEVVLFGMSGSVYYLAVSRGIVWYWEVLPGFGW